ncbi:MAG TPA: hypothetical protein VED45_07870 [Steroidobacteraceae bacterium]|nr:hypothetical protein [Steroidobacteraceae bacterium]
MRSPPRVFRLALLAACLAGIVSLGACAGVAREQPPDAPAAGPSPAPAQVHSCSAPVSAPKGTCGGCSVSCGDQQASCTPGEEWPGGSACMKTAVCGCR